MPRPLLRGLDPCACAVWAALPAACAQLPECSRGVMLNVIGEDHSRFLSMVLRCSDGQLLTTKDMPSMMLDERGPRKATVCQYVVARGEYQCITKQGAQVPRFDRTHQPWALVSPPAHQPWARIDIW